MVQTSAVRQPDGWVPVERRWLGLDRRTLAPALVVLGLALVLHFVLPAVNRAVPYTDKARAGDVLALARGVRFVPATGWNIAAGTRADDPPAGGAFPPTAVVEDGGLRFAVTTGSFDGDSTALLEQIKKTSAELNGEHGLHVTSAPVPIQTASGLNGVIAQYSGSSSDGALAAFVVDGVGIEAVITGPPNAGRAQTEQAARMILSISHS
ncbi:hypothetical protein F4553_002184 [Allocatelliglobosispora scoriae]|uniref:Uncharacterized protein n=1 Tax=Allocatelliglobosispora scoriae TaxID=643052 RepID=A0A841BMB3_9ACTN|nr:hypothetical protein [Allocatelliglobosispora scoriae]MBB5868805.1 hypothetical protein [Allocatelliglobosispora scoriae]